MIPWQHPKAIQTTNKGSILVTPEASIYIAGATLCEVHADTYSLNHIENGHYRLCVAVLHLTDQEKNL